MAWSGGGSGGGGGERDDVLLSVSEEGELAFWALDEGAVGAGVGPWRCTEKVRTGRKGFKTVRCSSAKKSALGMVFSLFI